MLVALNNGEEAAILELDDQELAGTSGVPRPPGHAPSGGARRR